MIKAIYKRREDGDYDFVAAFETDKLPPLPSDWPSEVVEYLNGENELVLIIENIDLDKLPAVWSPKQSCSHKFVDFDHCLKCGWKPLKS